MKEQFEKITTEQLLERSSYIAGATAEHDKARNQAIDEALKLLTIYAGSFDIRENYTSFKYQLEQLKTKP